NEREWLEEVVDLLPVPTLFVEPGTGRLLFVNRAASELTGRYTTRDGIDLPEDQTPASRVARGERLVGLEIGWRTPTGNRSLLVHGDTLPAMHGQPATAVVMFQDVSRLKEVEAELRRTNQAKDDFLSM